MATYSAITAVLETAGADPNEYNDAVTGDTSYIAFGEQIREQRDGWAMVSYERFRVYNDAERHDVRVRDMKYRTEEEMTLGELEQVAS